MKGRAVATSGGGEDGGEEADRGVGGGGGVEGGKGPGVRLKRVGPMEGSDVGGRGT